ncbi:MAG TPA: chemotaxis-specific protein-glutamate methyltransferase CheB [Mycobacteriales bacterium]|nr:chemotaxis-specific protein-glutamate methyltransferase CheB [Mycobacteriales bacterium]
MVVADDSAVQRRFVRGVVDADPEFTVVGEARNGREAVALVNRLRPAVLLMDLDLPMLSGLEVIERIMSGSPTPIVVYSDFVAGDRTGAVAALAAGAVEVLAKPGPEDGTTLEEYAAALRRTLRVASRVRVITHPRARLRGGPAPVSPGATTPGPTTAGPTTPVPPTPVPSSSGPAGGSAPDPPAPAAQEEKRPTANEPVPPPETADAPQPRRPLRHKVPVEPPTELVPRKGIALLVIGASTGGPQALLSVLRVLPADTAPAVLVVQHMAQGFIPGLAAWLDQVVALPVVVGESGRRLAPGTITIAPSGGNILVQDARLRTLCTPPDPGQFHVPGVDATFHSVAAALGPDAIGVILTGMGRDGAAGLLAMRERGAITLGQDEATSAVYGMPAAAAACGAVQRQLPLEEIGPELVRLLTEVPS